MRVKGLQDDSTAVKLVDILRTNSLRTSNKECNVFTGTWACTRNYYRSIIECNTELDNVLMQ